LARVTVSFRGGALESGVDERAVAVATTFASRPGCQDRTVTSTSAATRISRCRESDVQFDKTGDEGVGSTQLSS